MNKRQRKKQGTKLKHNGHYASYAALFLGVEVKGKPHIDKKWLKNRGGGVDGEINNKQRYIRNGNV